MKKLLAAISFFTRIPAWRLADIPAEKYKRVVEVWPYVGWITGGITALTAWLLMFLGAPMAVAMAYGVRTLLTAGLHEDGFADFMDGFGGGRDRNHILAIMKDSHIGSYGVLGLIVWFILLCVGVSSLPMAKITVVIFAADVWSKFVASNIVNLLPYARTAEQSKNKLVYEKMSHTTFAFALVGGLLPLLSLPWPLYMAALLPVVVAILMIGYMRRKIGGYTGDCCGALMIMCELSFVVGALFISRLCE